MYITSTVPLEEQYTAEQRINPGAWEDFVNRISHVVEFRPDGTRLDHTTGELLRSVSEEPAAT